jgi:hypothetical protein
MVRIKELQGMIIIERCARILKRNAMLLNIGFFFPFVPFKL